MTYPRKCSRCVTFIGTVLLVSLSVVVALVFCEASLRLTGLYPPPPTPQCRYWDPKICELYEASDHHGYRLTPSQVRTYSYPEKNPRVLTIRSNSHGFRSSREFQESDTRKRVLIVGDSFVFGQGVEEAERFSDKLEEVEPSWRVDNLGMTGWGLDLMLLAFEAVGISAQPDIVVISVYTDDLHRVSPFYSGVGFSIPRLQLWEGRLEKTPYPELDNIQRMHIYQALYQWYWKYSDIEWKTNEAILTKFIVLSHLHDFSLVMMYIPGRAQTSQGKKIDFERAERLKGYAKSHGIKFLDVTSKIHVTPRDSVFIKGNAHLNPKGHAIVATELHRFLAGGMESQVPQ